MHNFDIKIATYTFLSKVDRIAANWYKTKIRKSKKEAFCNEISWKKFT